MANIAIVGAGNVGANTAFFMAESNIGSVVMYDIQDGLATGKALDMMEAAPIRGYQYGISGTDDLDDVKSSQVLVLAAGSVREPGMKREDLYAKNVAIIDSLASSLGDYRGTVVIGTEPVDLMVMRFQRESGLDPARVLGLGGVLDTTRFRHALSRELGVSSENLSTMVIGRHSDQMMALLEYTRVSGVPVTRLLDQERIDAVIAETRDAGDIIVDMSQRSSSFYGPSAAAADVAQAIVWDTKRILPVSFVWSGHYGVSDVAMSLPAVLGFTGIERVLEPVLTKEQQKRLEESAAEIKAASAKG